MSSVDLQSHACKQDLEVDYSWEKYDARGIYLCRVCEKCEEAKLSMYRQDVLTNSNYEADEPVESDWKVAHEDCMP